MFSLPCLLLPLVAALATTPAPTPSVKAVAFERLVKARDAMRPLGRETLLGPWRLVTDVATGDLSGLDAVATHLPEVFTARTSLAAAAGPWQAVVIFASKVRYRAFAKADRDPVSGTRGLVREGLAAFTAGSNPLDTRVALVHALTRLLSRAALGEKLPAWLDEGLATDLAWCRVNAAGRLQPDTLDVLESPRKAPAFGTERSGPRVTAEGWIGRARQGRIPPLPAILSPDSRLWAEPGTRRDAATASALLVRWCLAEPARAAAFRGFLQAVSQGAAGDASALAAALDMDPPTLQKAFLDWLRTP